MKSSSDAYCLLYLPRGPVSLLRAYEVVVDEVGVFLPTRLSRTCHSQSRRMPSARPSKLRQWIDDGDTKALVVSGHFPDGVNIAVNFSGFDPGGVVDRGPSVGFGFSFEVGDGRVEAFVRVADQLLSPLGVRQGNFTWGDDMNPPFFPTGERLGQYYARYDLDMYDLFVIGHRKQLVWLGNLLRERLPPAGRVAAEQGWFEPSEELLGDTWPTPEKARPYMELIQNGAVVPWDS